MEVDTIRRLCLSLPNSKEKLQWGETLCFKAGDKIFATLNLDLRSKARLAFKCTPEQFTDLLECDGVIPAPYVGRYGWIALEQLDALPDRQIADLIQHSYEMVSGKSKITRNSPRQKKKPSRR
jgi:predicted DNA-binding protein (MmcQ/YjbR family)